LVSALGVGDSQRIVSHLKRRARRVLQRVPPQEDITSVSARLAEPIWPAVPTQPPGPTIVFLNDCKDQDNFGAHALVDGFMRILSDSVPNAVIRPIPSHWLLDLSHGLGAFVDQGAGMRQLPARYPAIADEFDQVADKWLEGSGGPGANELLRRFEGADLIILNGEGSVYRTNLSAIRELFLAWLCKSRLGIPTVFVNATVHLTDVMPILPAMVRKTFPLLDAVWVSEAR
jgi:hypothetical protein